jgi:hypothetical protein
VRGVSRGQILHLLDAYIANFSMDASPAVIACFMGNDVEILKAEIRQYRLLPVGIGWDK